MYSKMKYFLRQNLQERDIVRKAAGAKRLTKLIDLCTRDQESTSADSLINQLGYLNDLVDTNQKDASGVPYERSTFAENSTRISSTLWNMVHSSEAPDTVTLTLSGDNLEFFVNGVQYEDPLDIPYGLTVKVEARGVEGWEFDSWTDGSIQNPKTFVMTEDVTLAATAHEAFVGIKYSCLPGSNFIIHLPGFVGEWQYKSGAPGSDWVTATGNQLPVTISDTDPDTGQQYVYVRRTNSVDAITTEGLGGGLYVDGPSEPVVTVSGNILYGLNSSGTLPANIHYAAFKYAFCKGDIGEAQGQPAMKDVSGLILPNIDLTNKYEIYKGAFAYCMNITKTPDLVSSTIDKGSYDSMFSMCDNLNEVVLYAENGVSDDALNEWLWHVSPTGTIHTKAGVTLPSGISGLPDGWTQSEDINN